MKDLLKIGLQVFSALDCCFPVGQQRLINAEIEKQSKRQTAAEYLIFRLWL